MGATLLAWLAKSALMQSPIGAFLRWIPRPVWKWLALGAAALALFLVHQHVARKQISAAEKRGYDRAIADVKAAQARTDAAARARKARIDTAATKITTKAEAHYEQAASDIAGDARALRLRRPPIVEPVRVTSRALPGFPGGAGGGDGAAQGEVPGLAQIPWLELVDHGELCDLDRAKLATLQGWIRDQANNQEKAR